MTLVLSLVAILGAVAPSHALNLQKTHTYDGAADSFYGVSVVVVGDMDGDGKPEFAIGADGDGTTGQDAGRVFIFRGGTKLGDPPALIVNGLPGDLLGGALAPAGDQDADGFADLLIGAPAGSGLNPNATGRVLLVYGSNPLGTRTNRIILGDDPDDRFGAALANLGDFDGDGRIDFAVGAPGSSDEQGLVRVFRGGITPPVPLYTVHGFDFGDAFGTAVAGVGKTRGVASTNDLVVGAPFNSETAIFAGKAYLFHGGAGADTFPDRTWTGSSEAEFGTAVAGVGDVNGDGRTDWVIGAPAIQLGATPAAGRAQLYLGAVTPPTTASILINGSIANGYLGTAVAGIGDVNGDGRLDYAVSQPGSLGANTPGTVRVFLGKAALTATPDQTLTGEFIEDDFGFSISNGGRLTAAGARDMFFIGADEFNGGDGRVYQYGDGFPLTVGPGGVSEESARLAAPWPNPSRGNVRFALELARDAHVELTVVDVSGRVVKTVADGIMTGGQHQFGLSMTRDAAFRPGLYWATLRVGAQSSSRPFVFLGP